MKQLPEHVYMLDGKYRGNTIIAFQKPIKYGVHTEVAYLTPQYNSKVHFPSMLMRIKDTKSANGVHPDFWCHPGLNIIEHLETLKNLIELHTTYTIKDNAPVKINLTY